MKIQRLKIKVKEENGEIREAIPNEYRAWHLLQDCFNESPKYAKEILKDKEVVW